MDKSDKLDKAIGYTAYVLDSLRLLRKIYDSGSCHTCANRACKVAPDIGQLVRYNCAFYIADDKENHYAD